MEQQKLSDNVAKKLLESADNMLSGMTSTTVGFSPRKKTKKAVKGNKKKVKYISKASRRANRGR